MRFTDRFQYGLAATAVAAGVATFGWAVGGLAEVDAELSAAAAPPAADSRFAAYGGAGGPAPYAMSVRHRDEHRWGHDCPERPSAWSGADRRLEH